jgi:hypothetical protein
VVEDLVEGPPARVLKVLPKYPSRDVSTFSSHREEFQKQWRTWSALALKLKPCLVLT